MKFKELSKEHQEFLMYCLSSHIKWKGADEIIFPIYEEYKAFFDEFDEEYSIVDEIPESSKFASLTMVPGTFSELK